MAETTEQAKQTAAERQLICAILRQAQLDLRHQCTKDHRASSVRFFNNEEGWLETLCDLVDLPFAMLQDRVAQQYPEYF